MKPLYILKIGGSVATYKNRTGVSVRKSLLEKVARAIKLAQKKESFDLILIHGAGSVGHKMAHKYGFKEGTKDDKTKWYGALQTRVMDQKLNSAIAEIFVSASVRVVSANTASLVIQKNKVIVDFNLDVIKEAIAQNCIPLLYGDMVFDKTLGMSICSGDALAPYLAKQLHAQKILFATDVDGIFNKDPYLFKDAQLIEKIDLNEINDKEKNIAVGDSHNVDVTGGLAGKLKNITLKHAQALQSIEIFNGMNEKNYRRIFLGKDFSHTIIRAQA